MLPYLKLLDNVAILEYVNRLISKLDGKLFDNQINTYHIDSLLYSFAFGNLLNAQSLVGEGFVYSKSGRSCYPFRLVGHTPPSEECMDKIRTIMNNLSITKDYNYRFQISISGKSIDANTDLYLTNTLNASNVSCYFPLKLSTSSCGNYLFYSELCYNSSEARVSDRNIQSVKSAFLSSNMSLNFKDYNELTYIVNNYANILCKIMDVDFFIEKIYSLMSQYNLSTTIQAGWNKMFALVIDTRRKYLYYSFGCLPLPLDDCFTSNSLRHSYFTSNSLRHCVDTSLSSMVDWSNCVSIAFVFGMSNNYNKFQEYGMDFIFSCFV